MAEAWVLRKGSLRATVCAALLVRLCSIVRKEPPYLHLLLIPLWTDYVVLHGVHYIHVNFT